MWISVVQYICCDLSLCWLWCTILGDKYSFSWSKWAGAWMKPTCSFVLCVVDDCRTTLCSNLKWLRKDHNCLLSSINVTASSGLQSAEVTKGNNPKLTAIQICFKYFTTDVDISQLTFRLMFPARAFEMREKLGRWQEQQLFAIFTAILPPYHLSSSLPAFFFPRTFLIMVVLELQM